MTLLTSSPNTDSIKCVTPSGATDPGIEEFIRLTINSIISNVVNETKMEQASEVDTHPHNAGILIFSQTFESIDIGLIWENEKSRRSITFEICQKQNVELKSRKCKGRCFDIETNEAIGCFQEPT